MDARTEIMISLAVAMGANCIPCFEYLYEKAVEVGIGEREIKHISAIADKVKSGASIFLKNTVNHVLGEPEEADCACCCG